MFVLQVSVRYIGKLKKNGEIFDSNIAGKPFKFRLGMHFMFMNNCASLA